MKTNQYSYIIVCAGSVTLHPYLLHINEKINIPIKSRGSMKKTIYFIVFS